jgi:molecular chaperone DnaK (HSP70)
MTQASPHNTANNTSDEISHSKFLVGIDLGTTHTVVAYQQKATANTKTSDSKTKIFEIFQLIAPGTVAKRALLPSFRYHPANGEIADSDLALPWRASNRLCETNAVVIGEWARTLGAKVDGRLVSSAKSWLSHDKVDRTAPILPWGNDSREDGTNNIYKVSPLHACASYLDHIHQAWNHEYPESPLNNQHIVITIPASFDEGARSLTLEAAKLAGLDSILLLEEPTAACYDWHQRTAAIDNTLPKTLLSSNQHSVSHKNNILICDIGGGTTDLALIQAKVCDDQLSLNRIGVGNHLMLGGDNIDLALAYHVEQQLLNQDNTTKKKLSVAALSQLVQQTRMAKETLLGNDAPDTAQVTILGSGSKLIGASKKITLDKRLVHNIALDGFFPTVGFDQTLTKKANALQDFGLPYENDAAISKHIAQFIRQHCQDSHTQSKTTLPSTLLLNGGVFNSPLIKQRLLAQLALWSGDDQTEVQVLENPHPNLSVALGAVAYAQLKFDSSAEKSIKIGGGSARAYFLKLSQGDLNHEHAQGICILNKGCEEEVDVELPHRVFELIVGEPVKFSLVSSNADQAFNVGDLVSLNAENFIQLPELSTAIKMENSQTNHRVKVSLSTRLTDVGVLDMHCHSLSTPTQHWQLAFTVRKNSEPTTDKFDDTNQHLAHKIEDAKAFIEHAFKDHSTTNKFNAIKSLRKQLETLFGHRDTWSSDLARALFDCFLNHKKSRRRSEQHEQIWFRLAGFLLRPGFGYTLDDWRIDQIWPLYAQGLQYKKSTQAWADWWTFWRRAAGGLNAAQQQTIFTDIQPFVDFENANKRKITETGEQRSINDIILLLGALEHLQIDDKIDGVNSLLQRCGLPKANNLQTYWWAIGRLCARTPFYGSIHSVIDAEDMQALLPYWLDSDWKKHPFIAFATVMMSRKCGDRLRDLDNESRQLILDKLSKSAVSNTWIQMVTNVTELDEVQSKKIYGDALPSGLTLV